MSTPEQLVEQYLKKYPWMSSCIDDIKEAVGLTVDAFLEDGQLLTCGNGGSAADADHIAGELMKAFEKKRPLPEDFKDSLKKQNAELGAKLAENLEAAVPVIPLPGHAAVMTAVANDTDPHLIFAQQAAALGKDGDVLFGISTSGNALNVRYALITARAKGLKTIGCTGESGGAMKEFCDVCIRVPEAASPKDVQEMQLPVFHLFCLMIEARLYG